MPIRKRYQHGPVEGARVGLYGSGLLGSFVVYRVGETVIDSGPSNQWGAVRAFLGEAAVSQLLLTHHHEDHSGNAARIARTFGVLPYAPELGRAKLASGFPISLPQRIFWGRSIPVKTQPLPALMTLPNGMPVAAIHTPGHAKDLHCLYFPDEGWLFTADLFIARMLKFLRGDEQLDELVDSLRTVLTYDFDIIFCAHRGVMTQGKAPLADKLENLVTFCHTVQSLHAQGTPTSDITRRLLGKEPIIYKLTGFNFSKRNLVEEALRVPLD